MKSALTISVIIPTLNEAEFIAYTLKRILNGSNGIEIIAVDGGSSDDTFSIARRYAHKVIREVPSRGRQLRKGAKVACGDVFFFLHADSLPPEGWDKEIRDLLNEDRVVGGAFRLRIDSHSFSHWLISKVANFRSRVLGVTYGDQGIFVRRDVLDSTGGLSSIPLFEDVDLWKRLKRKGKVVIAKTYITTSSRRWKEHGIFKTTLKNWFFYLLYLMGVSPRNLYKLYYGKEPLE